MLLPRRRLLHLHTCWRRHMDILILSWLGAIVLGLGMAALQLLRLFGPSILMYLEIVRETRRWDAMDPSNPCLELWKDNLEDELWWF